MSLRNFHGLFIFASLVLCYGLGYWGINQYRLDDDAVNLGIGLFGVVFGIGLSLYFPWFLKSTARNNLNGWISVLALGVACSSKLADACAVCIGNPDSQLVRSANQGVLFMLFIVCVVLTVFAGIFITWARRISIAERLH